mgnify:CR=1 FL=1
MRALTLIFRWVLAAAVPGCVLIALILTVKKIFGRRLSAAFHYGIWFLLILRLLVPYAPQSPASALNLISPAVNLLEGGTSSSLNSGSRVQKTAGRSAETGQKKTQPVKPIFQSSGKSTETGVSASPLESGLAAVWLAGVLFCLAKILFLNRRFQRQFKNTVPAADLQIRRLSEECRSLLSLSADLPVCWSEAVGTPSLCGILHPRILLPVQLEGRLSETELKEVLLHEMAHYKRKDLPVLWVTTLLKAVYWFHPLVWYAFYRMRQDGENACDATVLSHLYEGEQNSYGHLLLHLLELRLPSRPPVSVGMVTKINQKQLKRRILMIANFQKTASRKKMILSVLLVALIGLTGLTGAKQASAQNVSSNPAAVLAQSTVMPKTGEEVAEYWADTLAQRNGAARFAILSDDLKKKDFQNYKDFHFVVGGSSPWVASYTVQKKEETAAGTEYQINYLFTDSTRAKYKGSETITVKQSGQNWFVVRHEDLDMGCPDLSDSIGQYKDWEWAAPAWLPNRTAEGTAQWWTEALKEHNGAYRYACLSPELQTNSEADLLQKQNWVIGSSGTSVISSSVIPIHQTANAVQYRIQYQMRDSSGKTSQRTESITVKKESPGDWAVSQYDNQLLPDVK